MEPETNTAEGRQKNLRDLKLEKQGHTLLLRDGRFQKVDNKCKTTILDLLGVDRSQGYGPKSFDLVMTSSPVEPLDDSNVDRFIDDLSLIELKTTKGAIKNERLGGFFFGVTENEYRLAAKLGNRFLFGFVVVNVLNDFGSPFAVLRTLEQVKAQTHRQRTQFQVDLRAADLPPDEGQLLVLEFSSPA